jgi:hypothetical protein
VIAGIGARHITPKDPGARPGDGGCPNSITLITILPPGKEALTQTAVKGTAKIDFGRIYSAVLEVFYSYDPNQTRYSRVCENPETCAFEYVFGESNQLGVNATLQARF